MLIGLGGLLYIIAFVCWIIVLIDMFKNEVWKGIVGFLCGLYALYYCFTEFQNDKKVLIGLGMIIGWLGGAGLSFMGAASALAHSTVR